MKKFLATTALAAFAAFSVSQPVQAETKFVTIGTGGPTGVYFVAGNAICRMIHKEAAEGRKKGRQHGYRCAAPSSNGSTYNLAQISQGEFEFGVSQSDWQFYAVNGTSEKVVNDPGFRSVFSVHPEPFQLIVSADSGVTSWEDLKGKRLNIGNPGSGQRGTTELLMERYGTGRDYFGLVTEMTSSEHSNALCDGNIDAFTYVVGVPNSGVAVATEGCGAQIVSLNTDVEKQLIEERPFSMSISAHTHTHEHRYITREDGWRGPEAHHHVINVTVSGGWWSGQLDERGLPHTQMADGAPNGYSVIEFDGHKYSIDFRPAARPADYQIAIHSPEVVRAADSETVEIYANVFNGSARSKVTLNVNGEAFLMKRVLQEDPMFVEVREREEQLRAQLEAQGVDKGKLWTRMPSPGESSHLWRVELPVAKLNMGVNRLTVRAVLNVNPNEANRDDSTVSGSRLIRRAD